MNKKEEEKLYHKAVDTKENLETENLRLEREVLEFQRDMLKRQKTEYDNYLRTKHKNHKNRNILLCARAKWEWKGGLNRPYHISDELWKNSLITIETNHSFLLSLLLSLRLRRFSLVAHIPLSA